MACQWFFPKIDMQESKKETNVVRSMADHKCKRWVWWENSKVVTWHERVGMVMGHEGLVNMDMGMIHVLTFAHRLLQHRIYPHYPLHHPLPRLWRWCKFLLVVKDCNPTWLQICKQLLALVLLQLWLLQHQEHATLRPHAWASRNLAPNGAWASLEPPIYDQGIFEIVSEACLLYKHVSIAKGGLCEICGCPSICLCWEIFLLCKTMIKLCGLVALASP